MNVLYAVCVPLCLPLHPTPPLPSPPSPPNFPLGSGSIPSSSSLNGLAATVLSSSGVRISTEGQLALEKGSTARTPDDVISIVRALAPLPFCSVLPPAALAIVCRDVSVKLFDTGDKGRGGGGRGGGKHACPWLTPHVTPRRTPAVRASLSWDSRITRLHAPSLPAPPPLSSL